MDTPLFDKHTSDCINFYYILDTNWLMKTNGGWTWDCRFEEPGNEWEFYPTVPVFGSSWFSSTTIKSYILLPVAVIVPTQVKQEIAKLHEEKLRHAETSNAKRNYSLLQKRFNTKVSPYLRVGRGDRNYDNASWGESNEFFDKRLLAFHELDLETVPKMKMFEEVLGPDSEVDKGIVSLARAICSLNPMNHCFISTYDTGIQAEASHLFYRRKENIGCISYMEEWVDYVKHSAKEIVKQRGGFSAYS